MTDDEFDALPSRQTVEALSEWRDKASIGEFCIAWTERSIANRHEDERAIIMRMAANWRESGLAYTFWRRTGEVSHLLVQKRDAPWVSPGAH